MEDALSKEDQIKQLRSAADLMESQQRVERAVERYGKNLTPELTQLEAFRIIAECLEEGKPVPASNVENDSQDAVKEQ